MLQVESAVKGLADKARNNPGLSAFAENVRQVRFNAWHYSDEHLWAGLVSHLFEGLARGDHPQAPGESDDRSSRAEIKRVREEIDRTQKQLESRRAEAERLSAELAGADDAAGPRGMLEWLGSPVIAVKVVLAAARQAVHDVRVSLLVVLGWAVLGGAYLALPYLRTPLGSAVAAVAVLAAPAMAVLGKLRAGHDKLLAFVRERRTSLGAAEQQAQRDIRELEDRLVLIDAAAGLARFLDEQAGGSVYREYQGLLGHVRVDLDQLSARLAGARRQWERAGRFGPPPLERIVLYIDDLDRCPPRRVVEVLEAVHLMLALDLFVVVVAVDARWLIRSLECHYHELFRTGDGHRENDRQPKDERRPANQDVPSEESPKQPGGGESLLVATPIDYLDKIFQVPFVLDEKFLTGMAP